MDATLKAVYRNGVFVPTTACDIPENTEVQVTVQGPATAPQRERKPQIVNYGRGPQIAGSRITVYDVMDYLNDPDWNRESIALLFRLSSQDIQAAIDYIEAHREEVEAEYQRIIDRHRNYKYPPEVQAKLDASHRRFVAFVQELRSRKAQKEPRGETEDLG
jgi:uncharacterized protein (DUF433 family)